MSTQPRFWKVCYDGLWLGGVAVVVADSEEQATELVRQDKPTCNFEGVTVEEIHGPILYNNSGDY